MQHDDRDNGSALVITFMLTVVVALVVAGALRMVSHEFRYAVQSSNWMQTLETAEAGVELSMAALQQEVDSGYDWSSWTKSGDTYTIAYSDLDPAGHDAPDSAYTVTVDTNAMTVKATGRMPEPQTGAMITRTVQVSFEPDEFWPFEKSLLAKNNVNIIGNPNCDSYNSEDGPYGGFNVGANCSVGSMSLNVAGISGGGSASVAGDVFVTENGDAVGEFWSGAEHNTLDVDIPDVKIPFTLTEVGSPIVGGNTIVVSGTTNRSVQYITGSGGSKNVTITGSGLCQIYVDEYVDFGTPTTLSITPNPVASDLKVELYVNGDVDIKGELNYNGDPKDFTIYGTPNCVSIACQANNDKSLTIYAPQADVELSGNAAIFGAVVANNINVKGTFDFHYDESLATNGSPIKVGYNITSWRELLTP